MGGQETRGRGQEGSQGPANEKGKWSLAPPPERLGPKRPTSASPPWFPTAVGAGSPRLPQNLLYLDQSVYLAPVPTGEAPLCRDSASAGLGPTQASPGPPLVGPEEAERPPGGVP